MISYAQNFEDVMLKRVFKGQKTGFYIDVGAWHPKDHSVTKHFYDQGWTGINVEPSQFYWNLLQKYRPMDVNLNCAISDKRGVLEYLEIPKSGASTAIQSGWNAIANYGELGKFAMKKNIDSITLANLCEEYVAEREVDFLKIDVEGAEKFVIEGGDWKKFRPKVLVIEAVKPFENTPNHYEWDMLVIDAGYIFVYFDGLNRFYVREESKELSGAFYAPPNILDDFIVYAGAGRFFYKTLNFKRLSITIAF